MPQSRDLENARMFNAYRWTSSEELMAAIAAIYDELEQLDGFSAKKQIKFKQLVVVLSNLLANWCSDNQCFTAYYRMKGMYVPKGRYNIVPITYSLVRVVDGLVQLGYVESHNGFYDRENKGHSRMARMRATSKLIDKLAGCLSIHFNLVSFHPQCECIILRSMEVDGKKINVDYEDTVETVTMRRDLSAYNKLLSVTEITLDINCQNDGSNSAFPDFSNKFTVRIFNNGDWRQGGRFYGGWWQNIPKRYRKNILISGSKTAEIDFSGLHIMLMYALEGIDYAANGWKDPYLIDGLPNHPDIRRVLKLILLIAVNAPDAMSANRAIRKKIHEEDINDLILATGYKVNEIIRMFVDKHAPISKYFFSGKGLFLQNIDSCIAARICRNLCVEGIAVLMLHDSFIVSEKWFGELIRVMAVAFNEELQERLDQSWGDGFPPMKATGRWEDMINRMLEDDCDRSEDFLYPDGFDELGWIDQ